MRVGTGLQERLHDIESQQEAREALLRQEADAAHYRIVNNTLHDLRMELDKCRREKNISAAYSQDEVKDLRAQLNICRGDMDHSRTREKKMLDDLTHYKQQPAAVDEPSIIHLESQIETQQATIRRLESKIKVLQTINTKAIADVRDAKRTAAAQFASARSLVEEIEAKFFAEQSECAEARQRGPIPGSRPVHSQIRGDRDNGAGWRAASRAASDSERTPPQSQQLRVGTPWRYTFRDAARV